MTMPSYVERCDAALAALLDLMPDSYRMHHRERIAQLLSTPERRTALRELLDATDQYFVERMPWQERQP